MIENNHQAWLDRIQKELPDGRTIDDMETDHGLYQSNGIISQRPEGAKGLLSYHDWKIISYASSNKDLLKSLSYGAEAILVEANGSTLQFLTDVQLDILDSVFIGTVDLHYEKALVEHLDKKVSRIVETTFKIFASEPLSITRSMHNIKEIISKDQGLQSIVIHYHFDNNFYKTINTLRAIKILFANLSKAMDVKHELKLICSPENCHPDFSQSLIYQTMGAMASIIGGTDYIYLLEWKDNEEEARVAQNILHLLRHESKFEAYHDAAAGSYYFEQATNDIVSKIWQTLLV